jgi:Protoglobin
MSLDVEGIPGYGYGSADVGPSPVSEQDLADLKASVLFGEDDERALRAAADVLEDQVDDVLDVWYGFVGAHPHLVRYFGPEGGEPDADYLARVRARFERWILDTCRRPWDRAWLDYQEEIALRHHRTRKNQADSVDAVDQIPLRHIIAFVYPITATMRPFLEKGGASAKEVDAMHQAWFKALTLQVALWSRPYAGADW